MLVLNVPSRFWPFVNRKLFSLPLYSISLPWLEVDLNGQPVLQPWKSHTVTDTIIYFQSLK
jgi:hypothetical protein